jgi:hypothetical protein
LKFLGPNHIYLSNEPESNSKESESVSTKLIPYRNPNDLKQRLLPLIRQCVDTFLTRNAHLLRQEDELKLTILVTWCFETEQALMAVLVSHLEKPITSPCLVELYEYSRASKDVKDSLWIRSREQLELKKSVGVNEIVMYDVQGRITEGLTSNFLVLMQNRLYTAPRGEVLWGTVLNLVIELSRQENIPVVYDYPRLDDIDKWQAGFITSTSRLLMPITELSVPARGGLHRSFERTPLIDHLETLVREHLKQMSSTLF